MSIIVLAFATELDVAHDVPYCLGYFLLILNSLTLTLMTAAEALARAYTSDQASGTPLQGLLVLLCPKHEEIQLDNCFLNVQNTAEKGPSRSYDEPQ